MMKKDYEKHEIKLINCPLNLGICQSQELLVEMIAL